MSKVEPLGEKAAVTHRGPRGLDRLYRLYSPWLTARIRRRFGWDAEDIVQEAWLWLVPLSDQTEIRHPKALLLKVASNIAITRARLTRRRTELLIEATPGFAHSHAADQAHVLMMQEVVLSLPQPLRDVFVLSRVGGLSNSQIAEQLGLSPKTVEWRMTKALAMCAAQLRR